MSRCDTCKFWVRSYEFMEPDEQSQQSPDTQTLKGCYYAITHRDDHEGQCRRFPPVLDHAKCLELQEAEDWTGGCESHTSAWEFPLTCAALWCGEYAPRAVP